MDMGLKLGLLSNTFVPASCLDRHLAQLGLLEFLPIRLYSYQYPFRKPDPRIFRLAAERLGERAEQILYVGDRIDWDILPALKAGMHVALKPAYTDTGEGRSRLGPGLSSTCQNCPRWSVGSWVHEPRGLRKHDLAKPEGERMSNLQGCEGHGPAPRKELTLFDSVSLIVGIIVGAGIYETANTVAGGVGGPWAVLGIWLAGGLLALSGALCYAELATTYPAEGGDYVYLRKAYGPWAGFLFGWSQLVIVRPADIALMAFVFARYAQVLHGLGTQGPRIYATAAIVGLTLINVLGVREGKWTQNLLTLAKVLGLVSVVVIGFLSPAHPTANAEGPVTP